MKLINCDIFLNVYVLINSFCIEEFLCTFWKLQIICFYLFYGLSCWVLNMVTPYHTNVKYNSLALLLGHKQVFFHTDFLSIYFPHILSISGKPQLISWERLDSSICVCTS